MVRLMLTLTPVVCILSGVAFSGLLELFLREDDTPRNEDSDEEDQSPPNNRRLYDKVNL
jgi:dolichyl-diphosphooligosaccharide--protein glycosyltransferase